MIYWYNMIYFWITDENGINDGSDIVIVFPFVDHFLRIMGV